jgi:hypothetical protein
MQQSNKNLKKCLSQDDKYYFQNIRYGQQNSATILVTLKRMLQFLAHLLTAGH